MKEVTKENALAAVTQEVTIDFREVRLAHTKPVAVILQPAATQAPTEFKADRVAHHGGDGDNGNEKPQIKSAATRDESARHDQCFAGHEKAK